MNISTVYLEITNQCNLNCKTCYNRSGMNRERKEISAQQIEQILKQFTSLGAKRFLFSGGEPTLHSEFHKIIEWPGQHPELSFGIVTNGTTHCEELVTAINSYNNITLQISLDGSDEEHNLKTRGKGHFADAIAFAKQIHNPATNLLLKMVISQDNYDDIENYYRLAVSIGFTPEFAFIYKSGNGAHGWENKALTSQQKLKALRLIDRLNHETGHNAFLPMCTSRCPLAGSIHNLSICIKTDGSIQPCQSLYHEKFTIGNAFAFDLANFSERLKRLSSIAQKRCLADFGCNKCFLKQTCGRGCMATADQLTGDPLGNDEDCEFRKIQFLGYQIKGDGKAWP